MNLNRLLVFLNYCFDLQWYFFYQALVILIFGLTNNYCGNCYFLQIGLVSIKSKINLNPLLKSVTDFPDISTPLFEDIFAYRYFSKHIWNMFKRLIFIKFNTYISGTNFGWIKLLMKLFWSLRSLQYEEKYEVTTNSTTNRMYFFHSTTTWPTKFLHKILQMCCGRRSTQTSPLHFCNFLFFLNV